MADTISSTQSLTIVAEFDDGDDRSITVDDPRDGITWADITALNQYAANVLIGDKEQSPFNRFKNARLTNRYSVILDPEQL